MAYRFAIKRNTSRSHEIPINPRGPLPSGKRESAKRLPIARQSLGTFAVIVVRFFFSLFRTYTRDRRIDWRVDGSFRKNVRINCSVLIPRHRKIKSDDMSRAGRDCNFHFSLPAFPHAPVGCSVAHWSLLMQHNIINCAGATFLSDVWK